jgi:hypothetical protein
VIPVPADVAHPTRLARIAPAVRRRLPLRPRSRTGGIGSGVSCPCAGPGPGKPSGSCNGELVPLLIP